MGIINPNSINNLLLNKKELFFPSSIPNLIAWFDAADISTISETAGAVSQWNDKSGNGNHATQATGTRQPTTGARTLNGRNVLDWDGSDIMNFDPSGLDGGAGATVFIVAQSDTIASNVRRLFQLDGDSYIAGIYRATDKVLYGVHKQDTADSLRFTIGSTAVNETPFIYVASNAQNGIPKSYYTGNAEVTRLSLSNNANTFTTGNIGAEADGGLSFDGMIAELLVYNGELSNANKNLVGRYLGEKWGIAWTDL